LHVDLLAHALLAFPVWLMAVQAVTPKIMTNTPLNRPGRHTVHERPWPLSAAVAARCGGVTLAGPPDAIMSVLANVLRR
jgi:hypothetical protein